MEDKLLSIFGISSLKDLTLTVNEQSIFVEGSLQQPRQCPLCGKAHIHRKTKNHRLLHLPPVAGKSAQVQVLVQQQRCVECKHSWWPRLPFATGKERMTHSFVSYALDLLRFGTIKDVSIHLGVGWDVCKKIHKKYLTEQYKEVNMNEVEYVSIDEFSIAKRHKYMTIVVDIATGRILHAVEGRKKEDVAPILRKLKKKHPNLKLLPWT